MLDLSWQQDAAALSAGVVARLTHCDGTDNGIYGDIIGYIYIYIHIKIDWPVETPIYTGHGLAVTVGYLKAAAMNGASPDPCQLPIAKIRFCDTQKW